MNADLLNRVADAIKKHPDLFPRTCGVEGWTLALSGVDRVGVDQENPLLVQQKTAATLLGLPWPRQQPASQYDFVVPALFRESWPAWWFRRVGITVPLGHFFVVPDAAGAELVLRTMANEGTFWTRDYDKVSR